MNSSVQQLSKPSECMSKLSKMSGQEKESGIFLNVE